MAEQAVTMLPQEKHQSDFSPLYFEFSRFSDGSKLNSSPRCCHSLQNDVTRVGFFPESCNIVSCFFYLSAKLKRMGEMCKPFSVLFGFQAC